MTERARVREIVETLSAPEPRAPEPPAGLREALLREVPARLELAPEVAAAGTPEDRRPVRWMLAAAASVVLAAGAAVVAVRVMEEAERPAAVPEASAPEAASRRAPAAAQAPGEPPPAPPPPEPAAEPGRPVTGEGRGPGEPEPASGEPRELREEITVTAEAPILDERKISRGVAISQPELEKAPTARDPWIVMSQAPGVLADRVNVGGNEAGQRAVPPEPRRRMARLADEAPRPMPLPSVMPPSTGGTREPNDAPYGDVFFRAYGTNPFVDTEDDPLSTFGLDVDTGSYGVVRRYLSDGHLPPPEAVRVEELVNAFDYGDPPPARGDFALHASGAVTPFGPGERYHLIRFAVRAREVAAADRKPAVLTFVVDVSGSMAYEGRLGLVQRSLGLLLSQLRPDDRVGLVVYGTRGRVVLDHTGELEAIRRAVENLRPEGSTNAEEGLHLGYELARRGFREGAVNRVILCSDGVANVGATGAESILERIGDEARGGIELTTVGFGMGNYNDVLMEQLANRGDGAYAYVDTLEEARRVFVENLTGTLQSVAKDARAQVEFDPAVVARYRLLGYENRFLPDERFRDDTVDAGEVGAGHSVSALYEVKLHPGAPRRASAATLTLRYRSAESGRVEELSRSIAARELERDWERAPAAVRLASVVGEFAEILKGSYWAKDGDLDDLFRRAQKISAEDYPGDLRVAELAALVGRAASLR